jgi:hypothetical protein
MVSAELTEEEEDKITKKEKRTESMVIAASVYMEKDDLLP